MKYICLIGLLVFISCNKKASKNKPQLSDTQEFREYWYDGKAEISSYNLQQAQYGTLHKGEAILIFVTEDFRTDKHVKLESDAKEKSTTVLKLNAIKKFVTGIYDYSIYTSVFTPVKTNTFPSTLKVANTIQEWCGQSFLQLNFSQNGYKVLGKSYFEEEVEDDYHIDNSILEDELWTRIRLNNPEHLPKGNVLVIPSMSSLRLRHQKIVAEMTNITLQPYQGDSTFKGKSLMDYKINFIESKRQVRIIFEQDFPHHIAGWEETYETKKKVLTSRAVLKETIQNPYWQKNMPQDTIYRKKLGLKY